MTDKEIARIPRHEDVEIIIRLDNYKNEPGLTIREFIKSERYVGFTKSGTRISKENFKAFKEAINSITEEDFDKVGDLK